MAGLPVRAAVIRAVSPLGSAAFGLAFAARRALVTDTLPLVAARKSGVIPYRFAAALALAPLACNAATTPSSPA